MISGKRMKRVLSVLLFVIGGFFLIRGIFGLSFAFWNLSHMADTSLSQGLADLAVGALEHARNTGIVRTVVGAIILTAGVVIRKK